MKLFIFINLLLSKIIFCSDNNTITRNNLLLEIINHEIPGYIECNDVTKKIDVIYTKEQSKDKKMFTFLQTYDCLSEQEAKSLLDKIIPESGKNLIQLLTCTQSKFYCNKLFKPADNSDQLFFLQLVRKKT